MKSTTHVTAAAALVALTASGCPDRSIIANDGEAPTEVSGGVTLIVLSDDAPGCEHGGVTVTTMQDKDGDGEVDDVVDSKEVCNGAPGADGQQSSVVFEEVAPGSECELGGVRFVVSTDGVADEENSAVICSRSPRGEPRVEVVADDAGCVSVLYGTDDDASGHLEPTEAATLAYCPEQGSIGDGGNDASSVLATLVADDSGACENGGARLYIGFDTDGSGDISESENVVGNVVICDGLDGDQAPAQGAGAGLNEGAVGAAVDLPVGDFAPNEETHVGVLSAGGRSYYRFESRPDLVGPYAITLFGVDSAVAASLYAEDDFATGPQDIDCVETTPGQIECATEHLPASEDWYLVLRELENSGNSFFVTISFGGQHGSLSAPEDVAVGSAPSGVRATGENHYRLTPAVDGPHTVAIEDVVSPDDRAVIGWQLFDEASSTSSPLVTCQNPFSLECLTPTLTAGHDYRLVVRELFGVGAGFTLRVDDYDRLHEVLEANVLYQSSSAVSTFKGFRVEVPSTGTWYAAAQCIRDDGGYNSASLWLYASVDAYIEDEWSVGNNRGGLLLGEIGPDDSPYLYVTGGGTSCALHVIVRPGAGNEGSLSAPEPIAVGVPVRASLVNAANDDKLSYYTFTTDAEGGDYTVKTEAIDATLRGWCRIWPTVAYATDSSIDGDFRQDGGCVANRLLPSTPYIVVTYAQNGGGQYDLTVEKGDTLSNVVALPLASEAVTLSVGEVVRLGIPTPTAGPHLITTTNAVAALDTVVDQRWRPLRANAAGVQQCTNSINPCVLTAILDEGYGYLRLKNRSTAENYVEVDVSRVSTTQLSPNLSLAGETVPPGESRWYAVTLDEEGKSVLVLQALGPDSVAYSVKAYDVGMASLLSASGSVTINEVRFNVRPSNQTPTLVPGAYWVMIENRSATASFNFDIAMEVTP